MKAYFCRVPVFASWFGRVVCTALTLASVPVLWQCKQEAQLLQGEPIVLFACSDIFAVWRGSVRAACTSLVLGLISVVGSIARCSSAKKQHTVDHRPRFFIVHCQAAHRRCSMPRRPAGRLIIDVHRRFPGRQQRPTPCARPPSGSIIST